MDEGGWSVVKPFLSKTRVPYPTLLGDAQTAQRFGIESLPDTFLIDRRGRVAVRASAHGHWQWCKHIWCKNKWGPGTGWTRVSRGSHAGHIPLRMSPHLKQWGIGVDYTPLRPGAGLHERSTTSSGIRLVPLETLDHHSYKPQKGGIKPPWTKKAYVNPATNSS